MPKSGFYGKWNKYQKSQVKVQNIDRWLELGSMPSDLIIIMIFFFGIHIFESPRTEFLYIRFRTNIHRMIHNMSWSPFASDIIFFRTKFQETYFIHILFGSAASAKRRVNSADMHLFWGWEWPSVLPLFRCPLCNTHFSITLPSNSSSWMLFF